MESSSQLALTAKVIYSGHLNLQSSSTLEAIAQCVLSGDLQLQSSAVLEAIARCVLSGGVNLQASSALEIVARCILSGEISLQSSSALEVIARCILSGEIALQSSSALEVIARSILSGEINLESSSQFALAAKGIYSGDLQMGSISELLLSGALAPRFVSATTNRAGTIITITFDKAMADPSGKHGEFSYKVDAGAAQSFSSAELASDTTKIKLTCSGTRIRKGVTATVSYVAGTVVCAEGVALNSFTDEPVTNISAWPLSLLRRYSTWAAFNDQVGDLVGDGESKRSDTIYVTVAGDEIAPSAPTLAATGAIGAIRLRTTAPTTDANGKTLVDLAFYRLYISSTPAIDISNPATYDSMVVLRDEEHSHSVAAGTTVYFVASAVDKYGNESEASAEVSGTSQTSPTGYDIPDDATGLVFDGDPKVGDAMLGLLLEDPASSWVGFKHYELEYAVSTDSGVSFGAWTALAKTAEAAFIHKGLTTTAGYRYKYRGRPVAEDDTSSTVWDESDNGGTGWPNAGSWATDNSALVAELILAERVVSTGEVRGEHIKATAKIVAGTGNNIGVLDGADATYRIYAGHATPSSAPFRVTQAGALYATGATIRGTLNADDLTAGTLNVNRLGNRTIDAIKLILLTVTGGEIANTTIGSGKMDILTQLNFNAADAYNIGGIRGYTGTSSYWIDLRNHTWYGYSTASYLYLGQDAALRGARDVTIDAQGGDIYFRKGGITNKIYFYDMQIYSGKSLTNYYIPINVNGTDYFLRLNS